ncbi:MAG: FAD-dependent monooxygenase [Bosea sp. (in: a-proteobacteria)]
MKGVPVIIAGAGIAGLTAAIAYSRAGCEVILLERRTGFDEIGAGIQIAPNASRILIELGVSGAAREAVLPEELDIRRWDLPRAFAHLPLANIGRNHGAPFWVMRRSDLQTALIDAMRMAPNVTLLVDRTATGFAADEAGVSVTVLRGNGSEESLRGSMLVTADGVWSQLRGQLTRAAPPRFSGYEAWRTLIPAQAAPAFMRAPRIGLWMGHNRHAVHYPVSRGTEVNLVLVRRALAPSAAGWDMAPDPDMIGKLDEGAATPLKHLIGAAPAWRRWPLFSAAACTMAGKSVGGWRAAIIGDAAHPLLPFSAQGAGMAIEDASELATLTAPAILSGDAARLAEGMARFQSRRSPRIARIVTESRRNGQVFHLPWPLNMARDMAIRRLGPEGFMRRQEWIYGWRPSSPGTG